MDKLKICHIASDEKFIRAADFLFEKAFPNCNSFKIIVSPNIRKLKYVAPKENYDILILSKSNINIILNEINDSNLIIYHGFDNIQAYLFQHSLKQKNSIWLLWGAEVYNDIIENNLFGTKTSQLQVYRSSRIKNIIKKIISIFKPTFNINYTKHEYAKILSELPSLGVLYKEEFDYFLSLKIIRDNTNFFRFTYYPIEFLIKDLNNKIVGNDILIGNSASLTNNHLEIIDILKEINISERSIYFPLNYGNPNYAKIVNNYAIKNLQNCVALLNFMPIEDYNKILLKSGIVIMNHYRQQAVGSVLIALYFGSKVYLNDTTLYFYLKRIGCIVFSISRDLKKENKDCLINLNKTEIELNRSIIRNEISTNRIVEDIKDFITDKY